MDKKFEKIVGGDKNEYVINTTGYSLTKIESENFICPGSYRINKARCRSSIFEDFKIGFLHMDKKLPFLKKSGQCKSLDYKRTGEVLNISVVVAFRNTKLKQLPTQQRFPISFFSTH